MFDLERIIRPNILTLSPYTSARDEYSGDVSILLDANEKPFGELNRYPDPKQRMLRDLLSKEKEVDASQIFIGNGSDEIIDLIFRVFCTPGQDVAATVSPSYGMYSVSAAINDVQLVEFELDESFDLSASCIEDLCCIENLKVIFLCSPNNPTGNLLNPEAIKQLLNNTNAIVAIDEAYIDFASTPSWSTRLNDHPNLIVLQTLSKAWGLASARIGLGIASPAIVQWLDKVAPPYNVSGPNQAAAIRTLQNSLECKGQINMIIKERSRVSNELESLSIVNRIYPSEGNFLLVEFSDSNSVFEHLLSQNIIVRNRSKLVPNTLRITI